MDGLSKRVSRRLVIFRVSCVTTRNGAVSGILKRKEKRKNRKNSEKKEKKRMNRNGTKEGRVRKNNGASGAQLRKASHTISYGKRKTIASNGNVYEQSNE